MGHSRRVPSSIGYTSPLMSAGHADVEERHLKPCVVRRGGRGAARLAGAGARVPRQARARAGGTAWPGLGGVDEAGVYAFALDLAAVGEAELEATLGAGPSGTS
jgi:hypothetical protein